MSSWEPLGRLEFVCFFLLKIHENCIFQGVPGPGVPQTILIIIRLGLVVRSAYEFSHFLRLNLFVLHLKYQKFAYPQGPRDQESPKPC